MNYSLLLLLYRSLFGIGRGAHLPLTDASVFVWRQEKTKKKVKEKGMDFLEDTSHKVF